MTHLVPLIDYGDWLEGAEGPRQSGASLHAPQGELDGGRRPPSCEYNKIDFGLDPVPDFPHDY